MSDEWHRQTEHEDGSVTMHVVAPFGGVEVEVRFLCPKCGEMVYSASSIEVLEPFYGADTASDSDQWSEREIAYCEKCKKEFEIDVVNGFGGMLIQVDGVKDGDIEYRVTKEYHEPTDEYQENF